MKPNETIENNEVCAADSVTLNGASYAVQELKDVEVIFPMSRADSDSGVGITIRVLAAEKAKAAVDSGAGKGMFEAVLDTDALEGIGLCKGTVIPVELRDSTAPAVPWGFVKKYK